MQTELVEEFIHVLNLRGRSETTIENYERFLKHFIAELDMEVEDIEVRDIRRFLMKEQKERGNTKSTISTKVSIIKSFFSWLDDERLIEINPASRIEKPKVKNTKRKYLTKEEIEEVREVIEKLIDRTLFEVLYSSGIRVSEAVALNWNNINFNDKKLRVINGKGGKNRIAPLSIKAIMLLKQYRESRNDASEWVFQSNFKQRMSKESIERHMRLLGEEADLESRLTPHRLRHSLATHVLNNGAPISVVSEILGHAKVSTTQIYAKTSQENIDYNYRRYQP